MGGTKLPIVSIKKCADKKGLDNFQAFLFVVYGVVGSLVGVAPNHFS